MTILIRFLLIGNILGCIVYAHDLDEVLHKIQKDRVTQDKKAGIYKSYEQADQLRIMDESLIFECIRIENESLKSYPHYNRERTGNVVIFKRDELMRPSAAEQIRAINCGLYPFTVVAAPYRYFIANREGDIVIVGLPDPPKILDEAVDDFKITLKNGSPSLERVPGHSRVIALNWLEITPVFPPLVPTDLLSKQKSCKAKEIQFIPSSKAYKIRSDVNLGGQKYDWYQFD